MSCNNTILSHQYFTDAKENNMNILYILLLLLPSLIDCAADELITHAQLRDGMWGTKDYPVKKYQYDEKRLPVLTKHEVMNHFWLHMKDASQKEKDSALLEIANADIEEQFYLADRKNIAAATWIGADLTKIKTDPETCARNIFRQVVYNNDIPLVSLFFTHKFPVHKEIPIISSARTIDMAKLLAQHGALDDIRSQSNSHPLHFIVAMERTHELELIIFYRSCGFSPMETDSNGHTPLEIFFQKPFVDNPLKGTVFLLTGLTPIEKIILLTKLNRRALYGCRANAKNVYNKLKEEILEFTIVQTFLKKTGKQALDSIKSEKCSVCLEPLDPEYRFNSFTSCNHIFHTECLNQSAICPYCKNKRCASFKIHPII